MSELPKGWHSCEDCGNAFSASDDPNETLRCAECQRPAKLTPVHEAAPVTPLHDARGNVIPMTPGPCLWCKRHVEVGREEAGSTSGYDAAWQDDGDYGCDESPESNEEGCGGHIRPYDVALMLLTLGKVQDVYKIDAAIVARLLG